MKHDRAARLEVLPVSLPPVGISRVQAAAFIGVSASVFDELVAQDVMPRPRRAGSRVIWDVAELAEAFRGLPKERASANPWDDGGGES